MIYLIVIIGLIFRFINLGQSFWLDEAAQLIMSEKTLTWIWFGRVGDFHPPLFYFLTHFWMQISHAELILRLLPLFFGLLTIPAIYLVAARLFSKKIALYAALFVAINPYLIFYSQEMRSYSLMLFLSLLAINYLIRKQWFWLTVVNSLLLYTHYSSFLFILAQIFYIIFYYHNNIHKYTFYLFVSIISYLPWLPQFIYQLKSGTNIDAYLPGWRGLLTLPFIKAIPLIFFKFTAGRIDLQPNYIYLIYIAFVLVSLFIVLYLAGKSYPLLTIWLVLPIFISLFLSYKIPQTQPFRLLFCLPPLLIYFSLAAYKHPKKVLTVLLYIFIVGNFMQITRPRLQREQWRQAVNFLNSQNLPVLVKFPEEFAPLVWYQLRNPVITAYPNVGTFTYHRIYLLEYLSGLTDPNRLIEQKMISWGYQEISAKDFPGVGIIREYANNTF